MGSIGQTTRITELAATISKNTAIVDKYLQSHQLPELSFSPDAPSKPPIPAHEIDVLAAQDRVVASTQELHDLMKGPTETLLGLSIINPNDALSLQAVYHFKIATLIPIQGAATYKDLSDACGLNEVELRRLLRHAFTNHVLRETEHGKVAHTAASRILAEEDMKRDIVGIMCEEMFPGAARTVDALDKWNGAHAPNESGYSLGHNTTKGLYEVLGDHPERGRRFINAMSGFAERTGIDSLASSFPWQTVSTVVDVGGGRGEVSLALAERFPHLHFTVQDLKHVIEDVDNVGAAKERVGYKEHDYFSEQTEREKDVYYFRYIFHNLPDDSCIQLLKAQIPALKSGAHILIQDAVVPEPRDELPAYKEKYRRSMDLVMLTFFGARERTLREWKALVAKADARFEVRYEDFSKSESGSSGGSDLLDVVWTGDQTSNS